MPIIQPDTSMAEDFSPLNSTYHAKIVAVDFQTSKKGNPMIVVDFAVDVPGASKPRDRRSFLVITGAGAMGFDQLLRACGFTEIADQYRDPAQPNPQFDTDDLLGIELNLAFEKRMYKDQEGNEKQGDQITAYLRA